MGLPSLVSIAEIDYQPEFYAPMGSADANWRVELGSPRVGFSCGFYNLDISTFYPPTGLLRRGSTPPPRVNPTRGAPSLIKVPVCRDSGIFSSRGAANGKEQKQARATRPSTLLNHLRVSCLWSRSIHSSLSRLIALSEATWCVGPGSHRKLLETSRVTTLRILLWRLP
jgi:hypothetical protein